MGKGVYIWQPEKIGTPQEVVQALLDAGVDTVALKINDAGRVFAGLQPYIDALRAAGIRVIGWGYIYLKWNALAEAKGTVEAINLYKPDAYLIDAEAEAKLQYIPATIYMNYLRPKVKHPAGAELLLEAVVSPDPALEPAAQAVRLRCAAGVLAWLGSGREAQAVEERVRGHETPPAVQAGSWGYVHRPQPETRTSAGDRLPDGSS